MTSSKFSVSRATRSTLYSISSPFHKSSSNLSEIFDKSHKRDSAASGSSSKNSSFEAGDTPTPERAKQRPRDVQLDPKEGKGSSQEEEPEYYTPATSSPGTALAAEVTRPPSRPSTGSAVVSNSAGGAVEPQTPVIAEQPAESSLKDAAPEEQGSADEPVLRPRPRKSRTWAGRLSTFLPALISPPPDQPTSPVHRKPLPQQAVSPTDSRISGRGVRSSATFDVSLAASDVDLTLRHPATSSPQYAPPPVPPKVDRRNSDLRPSSARLPPAPRLVNDDMPALPFRDPPGVPLGSSDPEPQTARIRKDRRDSPPVMIPPPVPREQITPPSPENIAGPGKLRKENTESRRRSSSLQQTSRRPSIPLLGVHPRATSPVSASRGRSASAQPPGAQDEANRIASNETSVASQSPSRDDKRGRLRRSWLPGGRSRSNSQDMGNGKHAQAWILGQDPVGDYKTSFLMNGDKVPELWNESGSVLVYLFPRNSGLGPSFKVPMYAVSSSQVFNELIHAEASPSSESRSRARSFTGRNSLSVDDAARIHHFTPPSSPPLDGSESPGDIRLYLPGAAPGLSAPGQSLQHTPSDFERLIAIRNLFAFLTGQPLVATKANPTVFRAFLHISMLLQEFAFTSMDGTSFGEAVDMSFGFFSGQLALSDVRFSREKTLEALILGERMRSLELYNDAFAHAVGKYAAIMDLHSPLFEQISPQTRQKLERAHLDMVNRQHNVNIKLEQFDFPSLFSGIASSTSIDEVKSVRFNKWRTSFNKMRQFTLSYYKSTFGNWPPKASSKKNPFSESGLNRLVLKALYSDMCALYDLIVDRESLTSRVVNGGEDDDSSTEKALVAALRKVLAEFDLSTPPVLPPIPFDAPQIPSMRAVLETYDRMGAKDRAKFDKRIKEHELILILHKAYNYDTNTLKIPFLADFKDFENHEARGKSAADLADQRIGYWLFLYVVIQSLPMLVIDAPGLSHTEGVEYFLCEPPMGNPPWLEDSHQVRKMWYEVSGGAGYVELSADSVMFSVEAIYHRSHCWAAAKIWEEAQMGDVPPPNTTEPVMSPLAPPPMFTEQDGPVLPSPTPPADPSPPPGSPKYVGRPRGNSPGGARALAARNSAYRSSIAIGLEPVPMQDMPGDRTSRIASVGSNLSELRLPSRGGLPRSPSATSLAQQPPPPEPVTSTMTFDDILAGTAEPTKKKKKGKFF